MVSALLLKEMTHGIHWDIFMPFSAIFNFGDSCRLLRIIKSGQHTSVFSVAILWNAMEDRILYINSDPKRFILELYDWPFIFRISTIRQVKRPDLRVLLFFVSSYFLLPSLNSNASLERQKEPLFAEYRKTLIKYYLCQCSSLIARLTNGPLSLRKPAPAQPLIGFWISVKRMEERQQPFQAFTGQTAGAKMTDRTSLSWHSVPSFLLFFWFFYCLFLLFILPPSFS